MNDPYLVILLERNYIASLVSSLSQRKEMLRVKLNKDKYDVQAQAENPKIDHDLKEMSQILLAQNNIVNCNLENRYKFKFQAIKTVPYKEAPEPVTPESDGKSILVDGKEIRLGRPEIAQEPN